MVRSGVHPAGAVLTIENTGEHLDAQVVATLVEPFVRGTERTYADHAGVGLGLAIVHAHDGTLTLPPRDGGGLLVRVCLPAPS